MKSALEISTLGRLIEKGAIKGGVRNEELIRRLETARWIAPGTRRAEWMIRGEARENIEGRLSKLLPDWRQHFAFLRSIGRDPFDAADIVALPMLRRQVNVLEPRINRRNWNAAAGLGPKHKAKIPANCVLTKDWVLRFRPNLGLIGVRGAEHVDLYGMAQQWTECVIPERAWAAFGMITGRVPRIIVTCENLGAYIDFPTTDSVLVIYSPGADIEAAASLLRKLPSAPWVHFGDLDQEGMDIGMRLAVETERTPRFFVPSFASEYLEDAARPVKTTWKGKMHMPLLSELQAREQRIFQEVFMLDARLARDVAAMIQDA